MARFSTSYLNVSPDPQGSRGGKLTLACRDPEGIASPRSYNQINGFGYGVAHSTFRRDFLKQAQQSLLPRPASIQIDAEVVNLQKSQTQSKKTDLGLFRSCLLVTDLQVAAPGFIVKESSLKSLEVAKGGELGFCGKSAVDSRPKKRQNKQNQSG